MKDFVCFWHHFCDKIKERVAADDEKEEEVGVGGGEAHACALNFRDSENIEQTIQTLFSPPQTFVVGIWNNSHTNLGGERTEQHRHQHLNIIVSEFLQ